MIDRIQLKSDHLSQLQERRTSLARLEREVGDLLEPTSVVGRLRARILKGAPEPIRGLLIKPLVEKPLSSVRARLRRSALTIYSNLGEMKRNHDQRQESQVEVTELIDKVEKEPDNLEAERRLNELYRARFEQDLRIRRDEDAERVLDLVFDPDDPKVKAQNRTDLLAKAKRLRDVGAAILQTSQAAMIGNAILYRNTVDAFGVATEFGPEVDLLHRNSKDVLEAVRANQDPGKIIRRELKAAVKAAELAMLAAELGVQFDRAANTEELGPILERAQEILRALPDPAKPRPALPEK